MNDGGFDQFFFNRAGDRAAECVAALHRIGAHAAAALLGEACVRFGAAGPSRDRDERQDQLLALGDDVFEDLDDRFYEYPDKINELLARFWDRG